MGYMNCVDIFLKCILGEDSLPQGFFSSARLPGSAVGNEK